MNQVTSAPRQRIKYRVVGLLGAALLSILAAQAWRDARPGTAAPAPTGSTMTASTAAGSSTLAEGQQAAR